MEDRPPLTLPLLTIAGMPIDLTLLRSPEEGGNADLVLRSNELRCLGPSSAIVEALQTCDVQRRIAISDLNTARKNVNDHRRSLRPVTSDATEGGDSNGVSVDRDAIKKEMRLLQNHVIPDLQETLSKLEARIEELLPKLANVVDETTFSLEGKEVCEALSKDKEGCVVIDPVFCVGGCETLQTINPGKEAEKKSRQKSILTGHGVYLSEALMKYSNRFLSEKLCKDDAHSYKMLQCPATASVDAISSHNLLGCSASCRVCTESTAMFGAPSYVTPATIHAGKSHPDAKLPIYHTIKTYESGVSEEPLKKDDIDRHFAHPTERFSIFSLTLPTLASSRMAQEQMAKLLIEFYESLLVSVDAPNLSLSNRYHRNKNDLLPMMQARTVEAPCLAMNECRRIVIEGYLPSTNSYIELASISNTSDFISRALGIKSGGTRVGKARPQGGGVEYPHIIHGTFCDTRSALLWIMENNAAHLSLGPGPSLIEGIAIPLALVDFVDNDGEGELHRLDEMVSFLPFRRRILAGKKGKAIIKEVDEGAKMEQIIGADSSSSSEKVEFTVGRLPTKLELEAEALSNPFGFLPIGV